MENKQEDCEKCGNPYFGSTDTEAYREAYHEMATGLCRDRLNKLHCIGKDDMEIMKAVNDKSSKFMKP